MKKHRNSRSFAANQNTPAPETSATVTAPAKAEAFTFGDPIPSLDRREIMEYLECVKMGRYYEPPISWEGLSRSFRAAVHHSSAIYVKRNILASSFIPHRLLTRTAFAAFVLDFLVFGNGYLEKRDSRIGSPLSLEHSPAKYVRRGVDLVNYWFAQTWLTEHEFAPGSIFHLREPDINQEVYGLPEYLSALNSAWLNESATLFRRKYYQNGSHAGFILYMTDAAQDQGDVEALRTALKEAKGPGNFRNLFMYAPNGKKDGIQLIPVAEVAAKDEFLNIKNVTRDDMLAAHRVPPQLMGIIPNNTGGFGDAEKAAAVLSAIEIAPLQARLMELNDWIGMEVIQFKPFELAKSAA